MFFTNIHFFIKNICRFREFLWVHRPWDYENGFLAYNKASLGEIKRCLIERDIKHGCHPNVIKNINICLELIKRIENHEHIYMYDEYSYMKSKRKEGVPKSACPFKQERNDWNYLYHLLSKYSQNFYD